MKAKYVMPTMRVVEMRACGKLLSGSDRLPAKSESNGWSDDTEFD